MLECDRPRIQRIVYHISKVSTCRAKPKKKYAKSKVKALIQERKAKKRWNIAIFGLLFVCLIWWGAHSPDIRECCSFNFSTADLCLTLTSKFQFGSKVKLSPLTAFTPLCLFFLFYFLCSMSFLPKPSQIFTLFFF